MRLPVKHVVALGAAGLAAMAGARNDRGAEVAAAARDCYAAVGPVLEKSGGKLSNDVRGAYVDWAEKSVLRQLSQTGQPAPEGTMAKVDGDPTLRDAIFAAVFPPDPSILQNYVRLQTDLGSLAKDYPSLMLAEAVAKRTKGVEPPDSRDVGTDYQPDFWTDESLQVPGSDQEKQYVRRIADYMASSKVTAEQLYKTPGLQHQLTDYLAARGVPSNLIAEVKTDVPFGERLKYALVLLGQRPAAREPKPLAADWLRHVITIEQAKPTSTPPQGSGQMPWPLFPVRTAPWPLLMPLSHPVPLSEANYIWEAFQGEHGDDRYHTYGPYLGDPDMIPIELRPSKWFWDAWPDRIVHGGECVPISKGTVDLYSALGKPAMWAGQPGHANLISFQLVNGAWTAEVEQAFAGGPDVTTAQWYFNEDVGTEIHYRDLYYWPFAEYHLGLAQAMNVGLKSYMDTRIAANIYRTLPPDEQRTVGVKLLGDALQANPFNPEIWYRLADRTTDPAAALTLAKAAIQGDPGILINQPAGSASPMHGVADGAAQYWRTLGEFVTQFSILDHAAPANEEDRAGVYKFLKTVPGLSGPDLAKFAAQPSTDVEAVGYDQKLAGNGDAYGELRMGLRYRDADGVAPSVDKAKTYLAQAAAQADMAAASSWGDLTPTLPAEWITVTASSTFGGDQSPRHLVDGTGMAGVLHDNEGGARSMWHTVDRPVASPPAAGLPASPAWVRFDFERDVCFDSLLIWNHNQEKLTDRGFHDARIYASADGKTWTQLATSPIVEFPRAGGTGYCEPFEVRNSAPSKSVRSVIIAANESGGNFGSTVYGLSAVHFAVHPFPSVVQPSHIRVSVSSTFSDMQSPAHLIDGTGMLGIQHDNHFAAASMWHTPNRPEALPPAANLPPSPAWARFDFDGLQTLDSVLIWNHNQKDQTDRGFRRTHIYGTSDGSTWFPLTASDAIELPRQSGADLVAPVSIPVAAHRPVKAVIIAADPVDGHFGSECYGLSAVRFVLGSR